jgi:2-phosphosulfolactate phosphatase
MSNKSFQVDICLSPALLPLYVLKGRIVVVVDVLRATSVMVTAFAHGIESITPTASLAECAAYKELGYLTAGERDGLQADGFDMDNSPFSYQNDGIKGKKLAISTTNGTQTIAASHEAEQIVIGSFLNIDAVANYLKQARKPTLIACAAWKGKPNVEDTLFAGALIQKLGEQAIWENDTCQLAHSLLESAGRDRMSLVHEISHVKRLKKLGIEKDVEFCLEENVYHVLPYMKEGRLVI